jgi:hypothetical protein
MEYERYLTSARRCVLVMFFIIGVALPSSVWAQESKGGSGSPAVKSSPATSNPLSSEVAALKEQVARQQEQMEKLRLALEAVTRRLDQSEGTKQASNPMLPALGQVASTTPMAPTGVVRGAESGGRLAASATVPPVVSSAPIRPQAEESKPKSSPLSFRIGDAEFTPGGFMDFTTVFRTTNVGSGVATSFGTIPYSVIGGVPNTPGRMTEIRSLAQNSRLSLKIASKVGESNVTGYAEADFAGNNPSSLFVTSNSSTLRLRLYFAQLMRGKFELLGGQGWSLMTPGRTGISPWPADLFISQVQDSNYQLGITWGRQSQLRMVYHPSKEWAMAVSIENPNQYLSTGVVLPGSNFNSQFDMAGNQTTTPNLHPDIIAKVAYDPTIGGKHMHAEVGGILRSFRTFNSNNNTTSTITGGGAIAGVNFEVAKNLRLMAHGFYSYGGGRYILGLGPDVIVKPDGTLSGVHAGSIVTGFEYQPNPGLLFFGYYGGGYFQRNTGYSLDTSGNRIWVGFGGPATTTIQLNANRAVQEPTFGITRTFWKSPKYGALMWVNQYSYVTRAPWIVPSGSGKNAHLSVVYTDLRYVLP